MSFVKEFKEFAIKGNAVDLAVGVIIGAAFGKIVTSIIDDLIMPVVGLFIGKADFSNLYIVLSGDVPPGTPLEEARKIADTAIFAYGNFVTIAINFLLLALVVFWMVKGLNKMKKAKEEAPAAPPAPSKEEVLLGEIRDLLKEKK